MNGTEIQLAARDKDGNRVIWVLADPDHQTVDIYHNSKPLFSTAPDGIMLHYPATRWWLIPYYWWKHRKTLGEIWSKWA